jgi:HK97 gp10 family phage protein
MAVELNIEGMDQLKRKLDQLSNPKKAKQIARKAGRQAMNLVRDAARTNAKAIDDPETREMIHKNIVTQGGKSRNSNEIVIRVGVKGGAGRNQHSVSTAGLSGGDTRHFRYIEFGTSKIPATPFLRPSLSQNLDKVTTKFVQVFDAEITKALSGVT